MFSNDEIKSIVSKIKQGGIILYPSDTVWSIGCDLFNLDAIRRVSEVKQRNNEKSFILLVSNQEMLNHYVSKIEPKIQNILDYHTRPVTVVYNDVQNIPEYFLAADGSIAIRIVQDEFCQQLIAELGIPLVSTSANISNEPCPQIYTEISPKIIHQMDYVVQYRQNDKNKTEPSVIIKLLPDKEELFFIRE
jgi:L-threonylcarbamoyladenylate synthase